MNLNNKLPKLATLVLLVAAFVAGCEKINHPGLGTYPKDSNVPGGPLKFYAAYENMTADSIRATFAVVDSNTKYVPGVSGQGIQFNPVKGTNGGTGKEDSVLSYLVYPSPNDFSIHLSDFTIAFWLNIPLSKKDNDGADGILAIGSTKNSFGEVTVYADHSTGGPSDSMDLKFHFMNGENDNWDFANYVGAARWPHMYDGNWHQVAFVYVASDSTATLYRDGVQFDQKAHEAISYDAEVSQLVVGGLQEANGIQSNYGGSNGWMNGWPGALDNVRFYTEALKASDIAALYNNKQ